MVLISTGSGTSWRCADRIVVLYEGRQVADLNAAASSLEEVVTYIVTDPDAIRKVSRFTS